METVVIISAAVGVVSMFIYMIKEFSIDTKANHS